MHVDLSPEQQALKQKLRKYFDGLMTPELKARMGPMSMEGGDAYRETIKQMGRDGWLGVGWPKEYGGGGLTAIEQLIFWNFPLGILNRGGTDLLSLIRSAAGEGKQTGTD